MSPRLGLAKENPRSGKPPKKPTGGPCPRCERDLTGARLHVAALPGRRAWVCCYPNGRGGWER